MPAGQSPRWIFRSNEADRIAQRFPIRRCLSESKFRAITTLSLVVTTQTRGSWSFDMDYAKPADIVASITDAMATRVAVVAEMK
jgi:hypothetical protein